MQCFKYDYSWYLCRKIRLTIKNCFIKQKLFTLIIWNVYQNASRFSFTTPNSGLNHLGAITRKHQNGPICEIELFK